MAKKKVEKLARVRYIPADVDRFGERLQLELLTADGWGLNASATFHKSAQYPNEPDANFVHYDLVQRICDLATMGYSVRYVGRVENDE